VEESTRANVPFSRSLDRGCDSNTANHVKGLRVRVKVGLREVLIQHTERRDPTTLCSLQLGPEAGNPSTKGAKQAVPYRTGREAWYLSVSADYGVKKDRGQSEERGKERGLTHTLAHSPLCAFFKAPSLLSSAGCCYKNSNSRPAGGRRV
jgi:hypothetical protein